MFERGLAVIRGVKEEKAHFSLQELIDACSSLPTLLLMRAAILMCFLWVPTLIPTGLVIISANNVNFRLIWQMPWSRKGFGSFSWGLDGTRLQLQFIHW